MSESKTEQPRVVMQHGFIAMKDRADITRYINPTHVVQVCPASNYKTFRDANGAVVMLSTGEAVSLPSNDVEDFLKAHQRAIGRKTA